MPRNTKEEALETRNRILDAAEKVFHANGVSRTSLADVAEAAEVTRGAIYWHFKNKGDLFEAMCKRVVLPMEAMMEANAEATESDPLGQLRATCLFILQQTVRHPQSRAVFEILFHKCEFLEDADAIAVRQQQCFRKGMANIEKIIFTGVERGQLPANLDTRLACVCVHAMLDGLLNNWLFAPDSFDLESSAEPVVDATLDALRYAPALRKRTD